MTTTEQFTQWWQDTHAQTSSAEKMWDSWLAPHRAMIPVALSCLPPVTSLYELGCGSGPNLRALQHQYGSALKLGGSEPSIELGKWASEHLGITIDHMALPDVPHEPWDIILSCYTMAYLEPGDVRKSLGRLHASGAKALILMEPMIAPGQQPGLYRRGECLPEWVHDYIGMLPHTGWKLTWHWPLLPPVDALNAVLIAERM